MRAANGSVTLFLPLGRFGGFLGGFGRGRRRRGEHLAQAIFKADARKF